MNLTKNLTVFFLFLILTSTSFSQSRHHVVNDFNVVLHYYSSSDIVPVVSYLGTAQPMYESSIIGGYLIDKDSVLFIYFDLALYDEDSLRFLEMTLHSNISERKILITAEMKKELPKQAKPIKLLKNIIKREIGNYPYKQNWNLSANFSIRCTTYQGCIDTDRSIISFFNRGSEIAAISNLGWVSIFKIDINRNNRTDIIVISNKLCKRKLEFYTVIF